MGIITKPYTFASGNVADGTKVNANFDALIAAVGDTATLHPTLASLGAVAARIRTNWNDATVLGNVIGQLAWKNYGNGHVIIDASATTNPAGGAISSNANSDYVWNGTYPTLMGWNGSNTYGVRVDSARVADHAPADDVYPWAKAAAKPTYSAAEVGALPLAGGTIAGNLAVNGNVSIGTTLDVSGIITTRSATPDVAANVAEGLRMCYAGYSTEYRNSIFNEVSSSANSGLMQFRVNNGNSTQAIVMSLFGSGNANIMNDLYVGGNMSALSITDRTPLYEGDALAELVKIKGKDGKIDHSTLPAFARHITTTQVASETEKDADGKAVMVETQEEGRDLGAMISMLTVAIKQLNDRLLAVEKKG